MNFVRFDKTVALAPWTVPSHASLFTGLMPSRHGVHEAEALNYERLSELSKNELNGGL
jgi:arylsulfatase A-like enzyme